MVAVKLVAYLVMEKVSSMTRMTFQRWSSDAIAKGQKVKNHAKRDIDLCSFFSEHFHLFTVPQRL